MKYTLVCLLLVVPGISLAALDRDPVESFPVPVLFGADYDSLVPDYGAPRGGGTRSHEGQDFMAPQGTPIVTPTDAIVRDMGTWPGGGRYIQTTNPGGERFRYMHLDEWADLDVGDRLEAGDYIGTVGDTGNAAPGQYHLHFEVLDKRGQPQDPYPKLSGDFTLENKMEFLDDVFRNRRDDSDYAEFLVKTFPSYFKQAVREDIDLPRAIERVIDGEDWEDQAEQLQQLTQLFETIPALLPAGLEIGDQNTRVLLLQLYIMYTSEGPARDRLARANPTGYYGSITAAAMSELQQELDIDETGEFDRETKIVFAKRNLTSLSF